MLMQLSDILSLAALHAIKTFLSKQDIMFSFPKKVHIMFRLLFNLIICFYIRFNIILLNKTFFLGFGVLFYVL